MESAWRGVSGMDAVRGVKGRGRHRHGWPLYAGPRSADGMREVERSEPGTPSPVQGQDLLVPLGGSGHPAIAKRDSPSRAKPEVRATLCALSTKSSCASDAGSRASSLLRMATGRCVVQSTGASLAIGLMEEGGRMNSPRQGRRPQVKVMCTTTPSTPADSSPESAAPPHSPAPYSGRSDSAATRTALAPRGWRCAARHPACRSQFR